MIRGSSTESLFQFEDLFAQQSARNFELRRNLELRQLREAEAAARTRWSEAKKKNSSSRPSLARRLTRDHYYMTLLSLVFKLEL
jgi:hypothetical protein